MPACRAAPRAASHGTAESAARSCTRRAPHRECRCSARSSPPARSAPSGTAARSPPDRPARACRDAVPGRRCRADRRRCCTTGWASRIRRGGSSSGCRDQPCGEASGVGLGAHHGTLQPTRRDETGARGPARRAHADAATPRRGRGRPSGDSTEHLGRLDADHDQLSERTSGDVETKVGTVEHQVVTVAGSIGPTIDNAVAPGRVGCRRRTIRVDMARLGELAAHVDQLRESRRCATAGGGEQRWPPRTEEQAATARPARRAGGSTRDATGADRRRGARRHRRG